MDRSRNCGLRRRWQSEARQNSGLSRQSLIAVGESNGVAIAAMGSRLCWDLCVDSFRRQLTMQIVHAAGGTRRVAEISSGQGLPSESRQITCSVCTYMAEISRFSPRPDGLSHGGLGHKHGVSRTRLAAFQAFGNFSHEADTLEQHSVCTTMYVPWAQMFCAYERG